MAFIVSALSVLLLFIISSTAAELSSALQHQVHPRDLDIYDPSQFITWTGHSTIVVGNYLYTDGGEVYLNETGGVVVYPGSRPPFACTLHTGRIANQSPENSTYSIDLTISWTNDTSSTPWYQIDKGDAPVLDNEVLWEDNSNTSFYAYDGSVVANSGQDTPPNELWQFIPDGSDSGYWNQSTTSSNSIFPTLQRTYGQASAYGNGIGYALGGIDVDSNVPSPGLISYNTTSGLWFNLTTDGFTDSGTSMFGQLQYVPGYGTAGLLLAFGGQTSDRATWDPTQNLLSFQSVNIFDPASTIWTSQIVSGSQPPPRTDFCSVGVQGDNGTYEIFIFGGQPQSDDSQSPSSAELQAALDLDAVYVLSLPAFNWQKASYTPRQSRAWHTCNLIGNRQMVIVGGKEPFLTHPSQITDIWTQGIGIFDLTAMEWKDQYDAGAAPYVTPDVVKAWYNEHGQYPASWSNAIVEAWFTRTAPPGSLNLGAIAGGVVGVVVGLFLVGLLTYFFMRRRSGKPEARFLRPRRSIELGDLSKLKSQTSELDTSHSSELDANHHSELDTDHRSELETNHHSELDANSAVAYPQRGHNSELDTNAPVAHHYTNQRSELDANGGVAYHSNMNPAGLDAWQVHEAPGSPKYELPC